MADILVLATAGLKPDQLADTDHVRYPRVDYIELKRHLGVDVLDYAVYERTRLGGTFRYLETKLHSDLYLAIMGLMMKRWNSGFSLRY